MKKRKIDKKNYLATFNKSCDKRTSLNRRVGAFPHIIYI